MKKSFMIFFLSILLLGGAVFYNDISANAANKKTVIVIDPGHGGVGEKNVGAVYNGFTEKDLTIVVAAAMKNELEKYDNVEVCLTRTSDVFMSLEDRAKFAKEKKADFVYSIHFNASVEHNFYGSEVWCSAFGNYYKKGYEFGLIEQEELRSLDLYQKGVKTKIGKTGQDYYGIIRQCVSRGIPCDIIEHCYLDHAYDVQSVKSQDFLSKLGVCDATAVAKFFKLKSKDGKTDFSNFKYSSVMIPSTAVGQDLTEPDVCSIKVLAYDKDSRNALVELTAKDSQSPIIYFSYSYDGGNNFCTLGMWDRTKETQSFNIKIPNGRTTADIICRAYNNYELFSDSNEVSIETR